MCKGPRCLPVVKSLYSTVLYIQLVKHELGVKTSACLKVAADFLWVVFVFLYKTVHLVRFKN